MLKKPNETQTSKSRPSSRTPARPNHIRTNSQSGNNQVPGSRRRKDTNEESTAHQAVDAAHPPAIPPRTSHASTSSRAKAPEHSFLTDVADVREMEKGLLSLLDDFHSGKLQAFGSDDAFMKMDQVREQQEQLARMHFSLDEDATTEDVDGAGVENPAGSKASSGVSDENMDSLLTKLHSLSQAIQDLHPEASVSQNATPSATNMNNNDHGNDTDGT